MACRWTFLLLATGVALGDLRVDKSVAPKVSKVKLKKAEAAPAEAVANETVTDAETDAAPPPAAAKPPFAPKFKYSRLLESKPDEIAFCGDNMEKIVMLTENGIVYYSKNFGKDWDAMDRHFNSLHSKASSAVVGIVQSPADRQTLLFQERNGESLISTDCAATFRLLGFAGRDTTFHPAANRTLLSLDKNYTLVLSEDEGRTWRSLVEGVEEFAFAKLSDDAYFASKNRIIALVRRASAKNTMQKDLVYSDDYFNTTTVILPNVEFFRLTKCCVYAREADKEMVVADAFGWFYHFYNLTIEGLDEKNFSEFNIIETEDLYNTFGSMSYDRKTHELNRLMKGDWFGANFRIIAEDLVCDKEAGFCDFVPLKSLAGSVLVNRYDKSVLDTLNNLPLSHRQKFSDLSSYSNLADYRQTFISLDYGEKFERLAPPEVDEVGEAIICETECFLNLHLQSSIRAFQLPKTSAHVPGLVIASGSISTYLRETNSLDDWYVGVFVSQDGGSSWRMALKGKYIFEILDRGSVIVAAPKDSRTDSVLYSLDNGNSWKSLSVASQRIEILAITVREQVNMKKLLISARPPVGFKQKAQVITVDFSNLFERLCVHDTANPELSDYEDWNPAAGSASGCLDGREVSILRRKPNRECFNADTFTFIRTLRYCACTEADFHCDFGFTRDEGGKCVIDSRFSYDHTLPPPTCYGQYFVTTGYRRNYETYCQGGVEHNFLTYDCPGVPSSGFVASFFRFIWRSLLFLSKWVLALGVIFGVYKLNLHERMWDMSLGVREAFSKFKHERKEKSPYNNVGPNGAIAMGATDREKKAANSLFDEEDEDPNSQIEVSIEK